MEMSKIDQGTTPDEKNSPAAEPSKKPTTYANDIAAIPNGGVKAWLQALGAFFLFFNTW